MYYLSGISENIFWNVHFHPFEENEKEVQSTDYISDVANQTHSPCLKLFWLWKQIVVSENSAWANTSHSFWFEPTAGHLPKCSCEKSPV